MSVIEFSIYQLPKPQTFLRTRSRSWRHRVPDDRKGLITRNWRYACVLDSEVNWKEERRDS